MTKTPLLDSPLIDPEVLELLGIKQHPLANMKLRHAYREDIMTAHDLYRRAQAIYLARYASAPAAGTGRKGSYARKT
jgi:hypothetical protein